MTKRTLSPKTGSPIIFISYAHADEAWLGRVCKALTQIETDGIATLWSDPLIGPGSLWTQELRDKISGAAVAICLISPSFLESEFIQHDELPLLLDGQQEGMLIVPVLIEDCRWREVTLLRGLQLFPGSRALAHFDDIAADETLSQIAPWIAAHLGQQLTLSSPVFSPDFEDVSRLPVSGAKLEGRRKELLELDTAWASFSTNTVCLVAAGGLGKSTVIEVWLDRMSESNYRGARRVFGWSFYSEGSGERATAADRFLSEALRGFGAELPLPISPWDRANQLVSLVRERRTLLILDGLEPLQTTFDTNRGAISDPALARFVTEVTRENPGLLVVTTREKIPDLGRLEGKVLELPLDRLSVEDSVSLLKRSGVLWSEAEAEKTVQILDRHTLALSLFSRYLAGASSANTKRVGDLPRKGQAIDRVLNTLVDQLSPVGLELLGLVGLFDRPCEKEVTDALRRESEASQVQLGIAALDDEAWENLLEELRKLGLLAPEKQHWAGALDAHPLIREYFGQWWSAHAPASWHWANEIVYKHYRSSAPDTLESIEDIAPLHEAMAFGCRVGVHQEVLDDVFYNRLQQGGDELRASWKLFGTIGPDLAGLSGLFRDRWSRLVPGIRERDQGYVLGQAGMYLGMLGRFEDAVTPLRNGVLLDRLYNPANASATAGNFAHTMVVLGRLQQSLKEACSSVEVADSSKDRNEQIISRTHLAHALHYLGKAGEARDHFKEAERRQVALGSPTPFLYAGMGFEYCELLLDDGQWSEVRMRATTNLDRTLGMQIPQEYDQLMLGLAILDGCKAEGRGDLDEAMQHMEQAIHGFRSRGQLDVVPQALLSRAKLCSYTGRKHEAREDLEEVVDIAQSCGMRLYEADAWLMLGKLHRDLGNRRIASAALVQARTIISDIDYRRREQELDLLERILGA